jgi:hypothetical protein
MKLITNVAGYKLKDKIRNTAIRNELNNNILVVQNNRPKWIYRVERMEPERISELLMDYRSKGIPSTGRPKLRWKDQPIL